MTVRARRAGRTLHRRPVLDMREHDGASASPGTDSARTSCSGYARARRCERVGRGGGRCTDVLFWIRASTTVRARRPRGWGPAGVLMSTTDHKANAPTSVRCAVITVSDTRTEGTDTSGRTIADLLAAAGHKVVSRTIV